MANSETIRAWVVKDVARLKPGECYEVSRQILDDIGGVHLAGYFGPEWSPESRVMERIVGSAYEFSISVNPQTGAATFRRLAEPVEDHRRTYVSPDRAHHYEFDGRFFVFKN
jgi:hypothetical protein